MLQISTLASDIISAFEKKQWTSKVRRPVHISRFRSWRAEINQQYNNNLQQFLIIITKNEMLVLHNFGLSELKLEHHYF